MEIVEGVKEHTFKFINYMTKVRFPNPKNPKKMSNKFFKEELLTAAVSGQGIIIEQILKEHKENPYTDIDVLLGDLECIGAEMLNEFQVNAGKIKQRLYKVEDYHNGVILK